MVGRRALALALAALVLAVGCTSDEAEICKRLDECGLFPTYASPEGDTFTETDCEQQVKSELPSARRQACADCVTSHACEEIVESCRSDCKAQ